MPAKLKGGNFPISLFTFPSPVFELSGLRAWYDANEGVFEDVSLTIPAIDCSSVQVWKDKSGNGHDLFQPTAISQPIFKKQATNNLKSYIRFDGVDDFLISNLFQQTLSGDCTAFIIFNSASGQTAGSGGGTNRLLALDFDTFYDNKLYVGHGDEDSPSDLDNLHVSVGNSTIISSPSAVANDKWNLLAVTRTGFENGNITVRLNKTEVINDVWNAAASPGPVESTPFVLGGYAANGLNSFLKGNIGEVMVYGSALSENQCSSVENYLYNKWNIGNVVSSGSTASFGNVSLWLDANEGLIDASGNPITVEGTSIAEWKDKSGFNRHAVQASANLMPVFKNTCAGPGVKFDGVNDYMLPPRLGTNDFKNGFSYYMVAKIDEVPFGGTAYGKGLLGGTVNSSSTSVDTMFMSFIYNSDGTTGVRSGMFSNNVTSNNNPKRLTFIDNSLPGESIGPFVVSTCAGPCDIDGSYNGIIDVNYTSGGSWWNDIDHGPATETIALGTLLRSNNINTAGNPSTGECSKVTFHELIIYNKLHSLEQKNAIETYLFNKWFLNDLDPDAAAYIANLEIADGQPLEPQVKAAYNCFVKGCKLDGIWDSIKSCCIIAGARTLQAAATTPLRGPTPTLSASPAFNESNYNRKTGVDGGSNATQGINSNYNINNESYLSFHHSIYVTQGLTTNATNGNLPLFQPKDTVAGVAMFMHRPSIYGDSLAISCTSGPPISSALPNSTTGFIGATRGANAVPTSQTASSPSTHWMYRGNGTDYDVAYGAIPTMFSTMTVKSYTGGGGYPPAEPRVAFYSVGSSIDLTKLDARVSQLMTNLKLAIQ